MSQQDNINNSYKKIAAGYYDSILSTKRLWSKVLYMIIWGYPTTAYTQTVLELLPDDFAGKLLDIPVGTGLFTEKKYFKMKTADITCIDYSVDMMNVAKERFQNADIDNVSFSQGDAGKLMFPDNSFDAVLSMNGFHVFPDKAAAFNELIRVLKPSGIFLGCFYVEGVKKRTDRLIRRYYVPANTFTPPFETLDSVSERLKQSFSEAKIWNKGANLCFYCVK